MKRFAFTLTLPLILTTWVYAQVVHVPDPNLRAALREALDLPPGEPITTEVMLQLTELDLAGRGITDLTGLDYARNLTKLKLRKSPLTNIEPVAMLINLRELDASYCGLTDISPLANLLEIEVLSLYANGITDVTPLVNLTQLRWLRIERNRIPDHSQLDSLNLEYFTHDIDTPCDMASLPLEPRIEERNFPSLFTAWSDKERWPSFDLIFCCPRFDARLTEINDKFYFRTAHSSWDGPIAVRDGYLAQNPTMVFLHGISVIWHHLDSLPEDSPWWLRDANGNIQLQWGRGLMNLNHPGWQQRIVDIAVTIDRCGLYDGIFIDGWSEWHNARRGQLQGQVAILKGIRERVRDNFLIMVNTNDYQAPASAPYINGLFMENGFPGNRSTPEGIEDELLQLENTLKWAEATLLEPRVIGVEGTSYEDEPPDTPRNTRWMRAITTMTLTFSNGYVAFPLRGGPWYDFWNADLGLPVGETLQLYEDRPGLYIREFTNGWAVYNHSGSAQLVTLPEEVQSAATGFSNTKHAVLDLDGDIFLRVKVAVPGDLNGDGVVTILDLIIVANAMGTDEHEADVNRDGVINVMDLVFIANQF